MNKSRKKIAQDYARNAIVDGDTKAGRYEKKMAVKEAAGEGPSMKSEIYMAGTSMGSYDKPMMKGSGLEMKCGCQVGKHMGGRKMMGGDGGSMPSVKKDNTRVKTPNNPMMILPELDGYDSKLRKFNEGFTGAMKSTVNATKESLSEFNEGFTGAMNANIKGFKAIYKKLKP